MYQKEFRYVLSLKILCILAIAFFIGVFTNFGFVNLVSADPVSTSVTVGNAAPSFDVAPAENSASSSISPTNVGSDVTIEATGTDTNGDQYYLIVCKTDAATATNGDAPTCDVGTWCVSSATNSDSQASCSYTALVGDSESNDWYAFVCDGPASGASCSSSSQGSGDSGSPFKVNHRPVFDTIGNDGPKDPGGSLTWSTNTSTTDSDSDGTADTVKLIVCKTEGISGDDCDGGASDRWCASSLVANSPSCSYNVPTPTADAENNAYTYLVDSHNFAASGANQGANSSFTVNNVAPVVTSVQINGGSTITLTESTTTNITLTATVTDNNACGDISTVLGFTYRSSLGYSSCDTDAEDDNNNCYAEVSCSAVGSGNTCDGASDASADYECTAAIQFHADPTDANTIYSADTWLDSIKATDDDDASDEDEVSSGVELSSLIAYDVTASISYGSLGIGQKNDPLDKTTIITATGNVGLDEEVSGTNMASGGNSILVSYQKYALASSTAYASAVALSTGATEIELNCQKTTTTGSPATKSTWWGIEIPAGTIAGSYTGTNTLTAVKGETANW